MSIVNRTVPVVLCMVAATVTSPAGWAQGATPACQSVTNLQRRIVERADLGVESLRGFVWMTNIVHGVDMVEVSQSVDAWRAAVDCQKQVARAEERVKADIHVATSAL